MNFNIDIICKPKSFYGLELSGILGLMIQDIEIVAIEPRQYDVKVVWAAPQIETGKMITLDMAGTVILEDAERPIVNGRLLTDEQTIVRHVVRFVVTHEVDEGLRLGGVPLDEPEHEFSDKTSEWPGAMFSLS